MGARIIAGKSCLDKAPNLSWKDRIAYLAFMLHAEGIEPVLRHQFENGWYIREIEIPGDTIFIGREHLEGHMVELAQGKVIHIGPDFRRPVEAPFVLHTRPGYQMVCYAITDVIGRTLHHNPDNIKDIEVLERRIFGSPQDVLDRGRLVAERVGNLIERRTPLMVEA